MSLKRILLAFVLALAPGAALACPDYSQSGDTYRLTGAGLFDKQSVRVQAGGAYSITACGIRPRSDRGRGYVTEPPDFTLNLSGMSGYSLVISVVSECDSVLLINTGAANWYYDDDDNGNLDAKITLTRPSNGWMDVWVGTHDGAVCDAVLSLETFRR